MTTVASPGADAVQRAAALRAAADVSCAWIRAPDFAAGCDAVLDALGRHLRADRVSLSLLRTDGAARAPGEPMHVWTASGGGARAGDTALLGAQAAASPREVASSSPGGPGAQRVGAAAAEPRLVAQRPAAGRVLRSEIPSPDGRVWGVLEVDHLHSTRGCDADALGLLDAAAAVISAALPRVPAVRPAPAGAGGAPVPLPDVARHDALLRTVVEATQALLGDGDLAAALPAALAALGGATASDRVYVHRYDRERRAATMLVEWTAPGVPGIAALVGRAPLPDAEYAEVVEALLAGRAYQSHVDGKRGANHALSVATGTRSDLIVPVFVDGALWGSVGFDDCTAGRVWSDAEVDVLRGAASAMAAAVRRDRAESERRAAAERRAALLGAVADAGEALTRTPDVARAFVDAGRVLGEATGVDRVNLFRYDHAQAAGYLVAEWARSGVMLASTVDAGPYAYAAYAEVWDPLLAGHVYHSPLHAKTGANAAFNDATSTRTDLFVPVFAGGRFWGALNFDDCTTERTWTDGEVEVLRAAAEAVAAAVRRDELEREKTEAVAQERERAAAARAAGMARANAALRRREHLLRVAVETSDALLAATDVDAAVGGVLARLGAALGADRALLGRYEPPGPGSMQGWLRFTDEWTTPGIPRQTDDPALVRLSLDHYAAEWEQIRTRRVVQIRTADLAPDARREQEATGAESQVVIGVFAGGECWGFLGFDDCRAPRVWDEAEVGLLQVTAAAIGSALSREQLTRARIAAEAAVAEERERAAEERAADLARQNRLLQTATEASRVLIDTPDFGLGCERVLAMLGECLDVDRAAIGLLDVEAGDAGTTWWCTLTSEWASAGTPRQMDDPALRRTRLAGTPAQVAALLAGEPIQSVFDALPEPQRSDQAAAGAHAGFAVPIFVDGRAWGVLGFDDCRRARAWAPQEVAFLRVVTAAITAAVQRQRAERDRREAVAREQDRAAQERAAELAKANAALSHAALATAGAVDFEAVLGQCFAGIADVAGACEGHLLRYDAAANTLTTAFWVEDGELHAGLDPGAPPLLRGPFDADVTPAFRGFVESRRVLVADLTRLDADERDIMWPGTTDWHLAHGRNWACAIPVLVGARPVGVIGLAWRHPVAFTPAQQELLLALASQAALVMQLGEVSTSAQEAALAREREQAAHGRAAALSAANSALHLRDRLLTSVTAALRQLLASDDFPTAVRETLRQLGEAAAISRVKVLLERPAAAGAGFVHDLVYEWWAPGLASQASLGFTTFDNASVSELTDALTAGRSYWYLTDDLPESVRTAFTSVGVRSSGGVPIFANGEYAGVVAFDDCETDRTWSSAEVDALTIAAQGIGAAMHRHAMEATAHARAADLARANAALRDREVLLAAAAQASRVLLESGDLVATMPRALSVLGQAAGWSRTQLILAQPGADRRPGHVVHSEWVADGVPPQIGSATHEWLADDVLHPLPADTRAGRSYWMSREEMPANIREVFDPLQILTTAGVSIVVDGAYVGVVAFDDCARRRPRTEHEMDALQTAARVIAAAIQRDRLVDAVTRERARAAQAQVAELTRANDVLARSLDSLASRPDRDGLLRDVTVAIGEEAGADSATLWLVDPAAGEHTLEFVWDPGSGAVPASRAHHPADVAPPPLPALGRSAGRELGGGGIVAVPDVAASDVFAPAVQANLLGKGVRSVLFVPLVLAGDAVGALVVRYATPVVQPPARLELVRALANQATLAVHLTRLADAARQAAVAREREDAATQRAEALGRMADAGRATLQRLTDTDGHAAFLGHVLTVAVEQLGASGGGVWLYDAATDVSRLVLVSEGGRVRSVRDDGPAGPGPEPRGAATSPAESQRFTHRAVVREARDLDPEHGAPYRADLAAPGVHTVLSVPMFLRESLRGSLNLRFAAARVLTPEEEQLAFALANQAVLALELTRLSEEASDAAVTEERNRFARELHDTLAQTFTGIFMQLQAAAEVAAARPDVTRACLARAEQLARDGLRYARQSVAALDRDADAYRDLVAAIRTVVQRATGGTATPAAMHVAGEPRLVEPAVGLHLLRICQEALGNAQRYAAATRLDVRLAFEPDAVTLAVGDDGVGFDPDRASVGAGLAGMRQRAERLGGALALRTGPGKGTVVEVRVPEHGVGLAALGGGA